MWREDLWFRKFSWEDPLITRIILANQILENRGSVLRVETYLYCVYLEELAEIMNLDGDTET